jgi:putative PIN family toxin of toxin-antitoxin system
VRRVVIDTSILVAGFRSRRGASFAILEHVAEGAVVPLATPALFLEYEAVMKRPEHLLAARLALNEVDAVLRALAAAIEPVPVHFTWRPQLADPSDEMVLEAAVNGRAAAIVTHNAGDFGPASRFGIPVLQPSLFLKEIA